MALNIKRAYDAPSADDGTRILVDRLWPRGLAKAKAKIAEWDKDLAPSTELRKWFGHDPDRWPQFRRRYQAELKPQRPRLQELATRAAKTRLTLLFGAKDAEHNNAVVLREEIERLMRRR